MSSRAMIVPASKRHTATVIFAHGLGDTGYGWSPVAENWRRRQRLEEVKFIFPHAPSKPITCNAGMIMPAWYDIPDITDVLTAEDEIGIMASRSELLNLIKSEIDAGIPSDRIVLGGFSQGGAMSIFTGVTSPYKLGGIVGLSSYLLLRAKVKTLVPEDNPNKDTPIFLGTGDSDPLVRLPWAQMTANVLKEGGWNVDMHIYPGLEHSADPEEIDDMEKFINERLPSLGADEDAKI